MRQRLADSTSEPWELATFELDLETTLQKLRTAQHKVTKAESALDLGARKEICHLLNSPFLTKKMNARALKIRIRERLRSLIFELDRLERSYRKQRSG